MPKNANFLTIEIARCVSFMRQKTAQMLGMRQMRHFYISRRVSQILAFYLPGTEEIQNDYLEAANVLADSPRSAAAILRLALQKLCKQLGEKGENINDDIAALVKKGLNQTIQKSLDALRITGNNAVHPGELDLTEESERVIKLFGLLNFIAQKMITEPKEIDSFYAELPDGDKRAVEKRDAKN